MQLLASVLSSTESPKVKHFSGLPPELTNETDERQTLGAARFVVIREGPDGTYLLRYDVGRGFISDTWHMNVEEAKEQALYEYGVSLTTWVAVPPDVEDVVSYGNRP